MDNSQSEYEKKYRELELLGRGNYGKSYDNEGSAYVVSSKGNDKQFVAKKMDLDGMSE
jgi:hypothetical protein